MKIMKLNKILAAAVAAATALTLGFSQMRVAASTQSQDFIQGGTSDVIDLDLNAAKADLKADIDYNEYSDSYYYNQLDTSNKSAYTTLLKAFSTPTTKTVTCDTSASTDYVEVSSRYKALWTDDETSSVVELATKNFSSGLSALILDHPEIFWLDARNIKFEYSYSFERTSFFATSFKCYVTSIKVLPAIASNYLTDSDTDEIKQAQSAVEEFNNIVDQEVENIRENNTTDADRLRALYKYIANIAKYDSSTEYNTATAGSVLMPPNLAVCEGYASAVKVFCDKLDIPCLVVGGNFNATNNTGHAWNNVKLDGNWYGLDITWDDKDTGDPETEVVYDYFLKGQKFVNNHTPGKVYRFIEFNYPTLSTSDFGAAAPETTVTTTSATTTTTKITTATTTEPPATTTEPPATTTEPPVTTTEPPVTTTEPPASALYGDANLDGVINISDVILINKYIVSSATLSKNGFINANVVDVEKNLVTADDSVAIMKFIINIIKTLPVK